MFKTLYGAHVKEMQQRWEQAMLAENSEGVLVHSGTPLISFQDDYEYAFRPNPHFLAWLPLTHHPECVLLVRPGERARLWFFQPEDYWHLPPSDPEPWWAESFDIEIISSAEAWQQVVPTATRQWTALGDAPALAAHFSTAQINPSGLVHRLQLHRTRKTAYELECMRQSSRMAASAHRAAAQAFAAGESEFDIHQAYLATCRQSDAELPYHSIVALNQHGAALHYQQRDREPPATHRSFLIDAGCTFHAYASDITRTYAASDGEFSELVAAMDNMQKELAAAALAGVDYRRLHLDTHLRIAAILADAGIIRETPENALDSGLSSVFYPHGLGHFIGLQTHDVAGLVDDAGTPIPRPDGHPFLRLTRQLEVGNVLTIEPGVYFIDALLQQWRATGDAAVVNWDAIERLRPYGGIRIEDNVAITASGNENLTRDAFATLPGT